MNIKLEFLGFPTIYDLFPEGSHDFALRGDTPAQLAEELIARFDSRVRESLLDPGTGTIDPAIQVMVNGKLIARDDLSGWIFREGDRVTFMKLLAGG